MKLKTQANSGFTLIELVVAIGIMVLLTSVTITSFNQGSKTRAVALGADLVASSVRTAQNSSQNPKRLHDVSCSANPNLEEDPAEFRLRFDTSAPTSFSLVAYAACDLNTPITVQNFTLPKNTQLRIANGLSVNGVGVGTGGGVLEIKFIPPFGKVTASLNGGSFSGFTEAIITVETKDSAFARTAELDGISGRVNLQ